MPMQSKCTLLSALSHGPCYFMDMVPEEVLSKFLANCYRFESDPGSDLGLFAILLILPLRGLNQPLCETKIYWIWSIR